ncbi:MAG: hypothetical protein NTW87_30020 [Planctomycetota bacterium]|nr:hypothetical protein [Planctomycetota bacterium]
MLDTVALPRHSDITRARPPRTPKEQADVQYWAYAGFQKIPSPTDIPSHLGSRTTASSTEVLIEQGAPEARLAARRNVNEPIKASWAEQQVHIPASWPLTWASREIQAEPSLAVRFWVTEAFQAPQADLDAALRLLGSWLSTSPQTTFDVASEAEDFVKRQGLEDEFTQVKDQLVKAFNNPEMVTVELITSPEDEGEGGERIVFTVRCGMDRQAFRRATQDFFAPLRSSGSRIYPLVGVLRDL